MPRKGKNPEGPSPTIEDYLQLIHQMTREGKPVHGSHLAARMSVAVATTFATVQRMQRAGLVQVNKQKEIQLTPRGREMAEAVVRRHALAERLLVDVLQLPWHEAHEEAHAFEHVISPRVEAQLMKLLNSPTTCPHGNPIPGRGEDQLVGSVRLSTLGEGARVTMVRISEDAESEPDLLEYLQRHGLVPGAEFEVAGVQPWNSLLILRRDGEEIPLGMPAAQKIWVRPQRATSGSAAVATPALSLSEGV
ncbi:MAG TPA: metal-dependent transcriptional regulator [Chloroflexota bacterium]|nr:metal-dependent transcriptional regulator [Chloroflexota bacterium]